MKSMRFVGTVVIAVGLAMPVAGTALADATLSTTGPGSDNTVTIDNVIQLTTTNVNITSVDNQNVQGAGTGNVASADNTSASGAGGSGAAVNSNATTTTVANTNVPVISGQGLPGGIGVGTSPAGCGCSTGESGSVLGVSTSGFGGGSGAMLPQVGASVPMNVSALRNAWHPQTAAPTTALVKQTQGITNVMLGVAAALSLLGAFGSAAYTRRKERRV